jgi:hypothetical protein
LGRIGWLVERCKAGRICTDGGERSNASEVLTANFFHAVGLGHGILPDTLAVAQAAVFMPFATLLALCG